jgi:hypothetical protein
MAANLFEYSLSKPPKNKKKKKKKKKLLISVVVVVAVGATFSFVSSFLKRKLDLALMMRRQPPLLLSLWMPWSGQRLG